MAPVLDEGCSIVTDKNTNLDDVNVIYAKRPSLPGLDIALGRKRSNSLSPYPYSLQQARAAELVQEEAAEGEKKWRSRRSTSNSMVYQHNHNHNHNHNHSHSHNHNQDHHPYHGLPRKGTDLGIQSRDCSTEPWSKVSDGRAAVSDFKHSNKNGVNRQHQPRLLRFYSYVDMVNDENIGRHCLLHTSNRSCGGGVGNGGNSGNGNHLLGNLPARRFYCYRNGSGGDSGRSGSNVGDYFSNNSESSSFSRSASESGNPRIRPGRHLSFGSGVVGAVGPGGSCIVNRAAEMQQGGGGVLGMTPLRAKADGGRGGATSTAAMTTATATAAIGASVSSGSSGSSPSSSRSSVSAGPNETTDKFDGVKGAGHRRSSVQSIDDVIQKGDSKRLLLEPFTACAHQPPGDGEREETGRDVRELISKFHLDFSDSDREGDEEG